MGLRKWYVDRYYGDRYYYISAEESGHVAEIEWAKCAEAPVILVTLDGESKAFFPIGSNVEGVRVHPSEQTIEHHFMADPLYVLANHTDGDLIRFAAKALGRLDHPVWDHAYTIPAWLSIA